MTAIDPALRDRVQDPARRLHFAGIGGSGMSALAQYRAMGGGATSGSDRSYDRGEQPAERAALAALGVRLFAQDGSGVTGADLVVASTAVEAAVPDLAAARERGIPIIARSELLALHVAGPSLAVAGTSGKSTVTAMLFEILRAAGRDPSLITGGRLLRLMEAGYLGNAWRGAGPLVFEADESDGSLVRHAPESAVLLNLHRDHMEPDAVLKQFRTFRANVRGPFVVSDDAALEELRAGALVFGFSAHARVRGSQLRASPEGSRLRVGDTRLHVPLPGVHNAWNALAAFAAARAVGVPADVAAQAIADYRGVYRRLQRIGTARGVVVIDDFAHNPEKLKATLKAAQLLGKRTLALFQPHGFAPARFQRKDLAPALAAALRRQDVLWLAGIYDAGGTPQRDLTSADLVADLHQAGVPAARHAPDRAAFVQEVAEIAREGDVVLILGARDPTLPELARRCLAALEERGP